MLAGVKAVVWPLLVGLIVMHWLLLAQKKYRKSLRGKDIIKQLERVESKCETHGLISAKQLQVANAMQMMK
jgi:hypothetical protein